MPEVKDASAEIAVVSPPFTNRPDGKTLDKVDYLDFIRRVFTEILRTLTPTGTLVCINTDLRDHARYNRRDTQFDGLIWQKHCDIRRVAECVGFRCFDTKIWAKSLKRDAYRYMFAYIQFFRKAGTAPRRSFRAKTSDTFGADVWLLEKGTYRRDSRGFVFRDAIHPGIVSRCIGRFTQPGDLVISPFVGSGTIPAVARLLARSCVGYEVNTKLRPLIEESIKTPECFPAYLDLLNTTECVSSRT